MILIKLILAHFIGDFLLQPTNWVKEKEKKKACSPKLYLHSIIHGGLIILITWDLNLWLLALIITSIHLSVDILKLYTQKNGNTAARFVIDQALHILSIVILWHFWFNKNIEIIPLLQMPTFWLYLTAILFLSIVSGIIINVLMSDWSKKLSQGKDDSLANAGKYIGILERLFIFLFIIVGKWEAIGFLLAAKSVFRFGDLKESKDRKLTEYILIGTLLSFGIAILTGFLVIEIAPLLK